jgi:hypothetical protein
METFSTKRTSLGTLMEHSAESYASNGGERISIKEKAKHEIQWTVEKFMAKDTKEIIEKNIEPYETIKPAPHNCLLHEGIATMLGLLCAIGSETAYSNANARIGVGNDATAPSDVQTGLIGTNLYKAMNATYPQKSGDHDIVFQSDFISGEAEFAWLEESIDNGSSANKNLCRQNTSLGTKPVAQTWRVTGTITWT